MPLLNETSQLCTQGHNPGSGYLPPEMIQCLSAGLKAYEGVRGAVCPVNALAYCGAGVAGRWGAGVAMYIKKGCSALPYHCKPHMHRDRHIFGFLDKVVIEKDKPRRMTDVPQNLGLLTLSGLQSTNTTKLETCANNRKRLCQKVMKADTKLQMK